jgi:hypothetical protein
VAFCSSSSVGGDEVVGRGGWDDAPSTLVLKDDVQGVDDAGNVWERDLSAPEVWYGVTSLAVETYNRGRSTEG